MAPSHSRIGSGSFQVQEHKFHGHAKLLRRGGHVVEEGREVQADQRLERDDVARAQGLKLRVRARVGDCDGRGAVTTLTCPPKSGPFRLGVRSATMPS